MASPDGKSYELDPEVIEKFKHATKEYGEHEKQEGYDAGWSWASTPIAVRVRDLNRLGRYIAKLQYASDLEVHEVVSIVDDFEVLPEDASFDFVDGFTDAAMDVLKRVDT